jgi:hypothetical protein
MVLIYDSTYYSFNIYILQKSQGVDTCVDTLFYARHWAQPEADEV